MEFGTIAGWILAYKYLIIIPLVIVEGPIVMVMGGFLVHLGYFPLIPIYFTLLFGDLAADIIWYIIGKHAALRFIRRFGHFVGITETRLTKFKNIFKGHPGKILFTSKLTTGFGFAPLILAAAGASHVDFKKYLLINFFGGFIWTAFLVTVGFAFGSFYAMIAEGFRLLFLAAFIIFLGTIFYGFSRYIRDSAMKNKLDL